MSANNEVSVSDVSAVTIVTPASNNKMCITGPFGEKLICAEHPAEIGLAVIEVLTGDMVAPPRAYRNLGAA